MLNIFFLFILHSSIIDDTKLLPQLELTDSSLSAIYTKDEDVKDV